MIRVKYKNEQKITRGMRSYAYVLIFLLIISCQKEEVIQLNDIFGRWELAKASFVDVQSENIVSFKFLKNSDQSAELSIDNWRNYYGFALTLASTGKLTSKTSGQYIRYEETSFSIKLNAFLKGNLEYTIKGDTMVIKNQNDWVKVKRLDAIEPSFCTKENVGGNVIVYVVNSEGSKVDITDFKVIRTSDSRDVKPVRDPALKSGNLVIAAYQNADYLYIKDTEVQFQGFREGKMVVSKNYVLTSNCGVWLKVGTSQLSSDAIIVN